MRYLSLFGWASTLIFGIVLTTHASPPAAKPEAVIAEPSEESLGVEAETPTLDPIEEGLSDEAEKVAIKAAEETFAAETKAKEVGRQQRMLAPSQARVVDRYLARVPPTARSAADAFAYIESNIRLTGDNWNIRNATWTRVQETFARFTRAVPLPVDTSREVLRLALLGYRGDDILELLSQEAREAVRQNARLLSLSPELYTSWVRLTANGHPERKLAAPDLKMPIPPPPKRPPAPQAISTNVAKGEFVLTPWQSTSARGAQLLRAEREERRKEKEEAKTSERLKPITEDTASPNLNEQAPAESKVKAYMDATRNIRVEGLTGRVISEIAGAFMGAVRSSPSEALDIQELATRLDKYSRHLNGRNPDPITADQVKETVRKLEMMAIRRFGPDYRTRLEIIRAPEAEGRGAHHVNGSSSKRANTSKLSVGAGVGERPVSGARYIRELCNTLGVRIFGSSDAPKNPELSQILDPLVVPTDSRTSWALTIYHGERTSGDGHEAYALLKLLEAGASQFSSEDLQTGSRSFSEWVSQHPESSPIPYFLTEAHRIGANALDEAGVWSSIDEDVKVVLRSDRWPLRKDSAAFSAIEDPRAKSVTERLGRVTSAQDRKRMEQILAEMTDGEKDQFLRRVQKGQKIERARLEVLRRR